MMKGYFSVVVLVVTFTVSAEAQVVDKIFDLSFLNHLNLEVLDKPANWLFFEFIPKLLGEKTYKELPDTSKFKDYLMEDVSNDDAVHLTGLEIITRSGYKYELHEAIADDGYVTRITRLINPLCDKRYLRTPPVLMEHGGTIDPTAYIIASSIQHHPEKWPRTAQDGPITSWNRSLAFVLANNGFDVWLAETRGSGDGNKKYKPEKAVESVLEGRNRLKNLTKGESLKELSKHHKWQYWDYSQDDIIAHELKSHMDLLIDKTGSEKLLVFVYSLSSPTAFGFFSTRPDYAEKVQGLVVMAPITSGEHVNRGVKVVVEMICPLVPKLFGTILLDGIVFTRPVRDLVVGLSKSRFLRYSVVKAFINYAFGASSRYQTVLDLSVLGHLLRPIAFKEAQQLCQQMKKNKLSKYDYGKAKNLLIYGTEDPPEYKISEFHVKDWIVVSAENDGFSTQAVYEHLMEEVFPKPKATVFAPNFSHADLFLGLGNDKYVNMPIMRYFQSRSTVPHIGSSDHKTRSSRQVEFRSFKLPDLEQFKRSLRPSEAISSDMVADTLTYLQKAIFKSSDLIGGGGGDQESVVGQFKSKMQELLKGVESLENLGDFLKPVSGNKEKEFSDYY